MLYFDHSATTPIHPTVLNFMNSIQVKVYGNPSSIHQQGRKAKAIIEKARNQVARAIGAKSNQIIFTGGGSEANNQILNFLTAIPMISQQLPLFMVITGLRFQPEDLFHHQLH